MDQDIQRKTTAMLRILSGEKKPLGAAIISRRLGEQGIELTERAVRYHLKLMDERGLTKGHDRAGRLITEKGLEELANALVTDKIGLIISKIDALSFQTSLDIERKKGLVILNVSLIPKEDFAKALKIMREVFDSRLVLSDLVAVGGAGEMVGGVEVPDGKVGFGTVCSVTLNGVLIKAGIPVESRFGGIVQMVDRKPLRFTDLITYAGSSLDPLEIFIQSRMTSVRDVVKKGEGKMLASFREVPAIAADRTAEVFEGLAEIGLRGLLLAGRPGQPVLEVTVSPDRVGLVVIGGLNPLASLEEAGIHTVNRAMSTLIDFSELQPFSSL